MGTTPLANSFLKKEALSQEEKYLPLHAYVCDSCLLVQIEEFESPEQIFSEYAYFSSYSTTWLTHCQKYVEEMIQRYSLDASHQVIEIASNDGYLLQFFQQKGIGVLGVEPAQNVAKVALEKKIPTWVKFFGIETAQTMAKADLLIGNNVLAHVPHLNDFIAGLKIVLKSNGVITLEFPHLLALMEETQFDTIYHEHFSYFSLLALEKIFQAHDLKIVDVEQLATHGGSLRLYVRHLTDMTEPVSSRVENLRHEEISAGLHQVSTYQAFAGKAKQIKDSALEFFRRATAAGKKVAGYGAPAKGNTLLNYCGITSSLLPYTVDLSPHKQGLYLPGTHIPIYSPDRIKEDKPDYLFILPWNLQEEIKHQMSFIRQWGGKFVVPIPQLEVV